MKDKTDRFRFLVDNRKKVVKAIKRHENSEGLKGAWNELREVIPGFDPLMTYPTFKAYSKFLLIYDEDMNKALGIEGDPPAGYVPKRFLTWTVQFQFPYFRLFKRINKRLCSIHIGRRWNKSLAKRKIQAFSP